MLLLHLIFMELVLLKCWVSLIQCTIVILNTHSAAWWLFSVHSGEEHGLQKMMVRRIDLRLLTGEEYTWPDKS